jgi:hypothetical protein
MNPRYLALGDLLPQKVNATTLATARAIIPGLSLPYPNFTGTISQMLRPFPQYNNITDLWGDVGNSNYNSMQVYLSQRLSHGLTFNFNYVYAKAFDDTGSNMVSAQSFTMGSAYNWQNQKALTQLPAHTVNLLAVYQLPLGKGRSYLNDGGLVSKIAGGWQVSGIVTYRSGLPIGTIGAACNLPNAGGGYANYNPNFSGPVRINGGWGNGNLIGSNATVFLNKNAFVSPTSYTYGNTPRTNVFGIQNPGTYDQDISLKREFAIHELVKLAVQADAFNAFNLVTFAAPSTNITSSNFGKISSQSNSPRVLQLGARISF